MNTKKKKNWENLQCQSIDLSRENVNIKQKIVFTIKYLVFEIRKEYIEKIKLKQFYEHSGLFFNSKSKGKM